MAKSDNVILNHRRFSFDNGIPKNVNFWNFAPVWPGRERARLEPKEFSRQIRSAINYTAPGGHLVLWMPASELHRTPVDPVAMHPWITQGTLISGSYPVHIGYIYSAGNTGLVKWDTKLILDSRGKRGANSSLAMRFLLESLLLAPQSLVVDPYASKSAILPTWCRRMGISYRGYIASSKLYEEAEKRLAQVEIPGIQLDIPV